MSEYSTDYHWKPWKFVGGAPKGYWRGLAASFASSDPKALETMKEYLTDLGQTYGVVDLSDWYEVLGNSSIQTFFVSHNFGSFESVLKRTFPSHQWHFEPNINNTDSPWKGTL